MNNKSLKVFEGPFKCWKDASTQSTGYHGNRILKKVLKTSLEVKKGIYAFERDSVGFKKPSFDWPLLSIILRKSITQKKTLNILDFGGSLGSSYFQHLPMLSECPLSWHVIEQKHFVDAGKIHFQSESLFFYETIEECITKTEIDIIILSSILQYLESPEPVIDDLLRIGASNIFIDKTIVNNSKKCRIYIQNVPASIYEASYPCRSLSESWLLDNFTSSYELISDFNSLPFPALHLINSFFKGFVFQKRI